MASLPHQSSELIRFLGQTSSYPHEPDYVKHIQTHASHVFIVPPYVYKIKKPVDFGFLNFSTLEKRQYFCTREIELNRRLCADIYLGVVPIRRSNGRFTLDGAENDNVIEYAVHMKKLSEEYLLSERVKNQSLTIHHLDRVADKLASFYRNQTPTPEVLEWGATKKIRTNTDENFQQTRPFVEQTLSRPVFEAICHYTDGYLEHHAPVFQRRIMEQRIVDGHGDLHLEHIHVSPDNVCIYDCIEFNNRFRYQDTACDLAYLAMDLDNNDLWELSRHFTERMSQKLEDPDLNRIITFYKCYRAYVKGKIKSLQSEQTTDQDERNILNISATRYFSLSLRYALLGSRPFALIFIGLPGSGKSTLARKLAGQLRIDYFSSDSIRKKMAGLPVNQRSPESRRKELYSPHMTDQTYSTLQHQTIACLQNGYPAIVDATFSKITDREAFVTQLQSHNISFCFIETQAADETIKQRLTERDKQPDISSDARLEDFEKLYNRYEPPSEIPREHLVEVSTQQSLPQSLRQLYLHLSKLNIRRG